MSPTMRKFLEAVLACAQEDESVSERLDDMRRSLVEVRREVHHVQRQNYLLLRLVRQLLEQTPDPAQVAALGEEIAKLEASATQVTADMAVNP